MPLETGSLFRVGPTGDPMEYVGYAAGENPGEVVVVGRINPDQPVSEGALHRIVSPQILAQEGRKIGPFGEAFPYASYIAHQHLWQDQFPAVEVPYPSQALVDFLRQTKEGGITMFEPYFLPSATFTQEHIRMNGQTYSYPEEWQKPEDWFYKQIQEKKVDKRALTLPGGWVAIDTTLRPDYDNGNQQYPHDPLRPLLETLEKAGKIAPSAPGSRFGVSPDDQEAEVFPLIESTLNLPPNTITVPTALMFNVIGNMSHPEFGTASTYEWFADAFGGVGRLVGGSSGYGGLSSVYRSSSSIRDDYIGFRLLGRFF